MPHPHEESARLADLRRRAASRLPGGRGTTAPATDALAVLHALACVPETASDALTLLHELQVHQIELDMQAQELRESRVDLETTLRRQIELYDFQPVACFTIDPRLVVHELNPAGAEMLGIGREEACGLGLDHFVSVDSRPRLMELVSKPVAVGPEASCLLWLCPRHAPERLVRAHIGADPAAVRYFVVLTSAGCEQASQPKSR